MRRTLWALVAVASVFSAGCAGETARDDACPEQSPAAGSACAEEGLTCTYSAGGCYLGAKAYCGNGEWQPQVGWSGCDPSPPPPAPTPTDPPPPKPTPEPTCPESIPDAGTSCDHKLSCDYAQLIGGCGFGQAQTWCDGGSWAVGASGVCSPAPTCDPFGTWSIEIDTSAAYQYCGFSAPPTTQSVTLGPNGTVQADWDLSVTPDGCGLVFSDDYEYSGYGEYGSESHTLELKLAGDTATGTYTFTGSGLSTGSCSVSVTATRLK